MIGERSGLYRVKITKPGHLPDGIPKRPHCIDPQKAIDSCLSCDRGACTGDCMRRKIASGLTPKAVSKFAPKKVDPDRISELYMSGLTMREIGKRLGVSRSCVGYWLGKIKVKKAVE